MIGFWMTNLLIPGDPDELNISAVSGNWELTKYEEYSASKTAIVNGQCAHTYAIENDISTDDGAAACDTILDDMTPILLATSYISGLAVTAKASLPHSDVAIMQPSGHWPRARAMGIGKCCVSTQDEFVETVEKFISAWPTQAQSEKILFLIHHWLDALGCWSFEDFYLSATTLLQIIAATEKRITRNNKLSYLRAIESASRRVGIHSLNRDFKDMRNNLIHEGKLLGGQFAGADMRACSAVSSELMNWFDDYVHAVMNLGPVTRKRFSSADFMSLNAYTL